MRSGMLPAAVLVAVVACEGEQDNDGRSTLDAAPAADAARVYEEASVGRDAGSIKLDGGAACELARTNVTSLTWRRTYGPCPPGTSCGPEQVTFADQGVTVEVMGERRDCLLSEATIAEYRVLVANAGCALSAKSCGAPAQVDEYHEIEAMFADGTSNVQSVLGCADLGITKLDEWIFRLDCLRNISSP